MTQPDRVVPSVSVQPNRIDLAETTTLTLALEGPAPLRVEAPAQAEKWLATRSALMWQIQPLGPPAVQKLDDGRERWEQSFRLSPFFHGDRVAITFAPIQVNGQDVQFDTQTLRVRKTIEDAKPENAVPITGIEPLPEIPPKPLDASGWPFLAVLATVFALVVCIVLVRRRLAKTPPIPPTDWADRELARLEVERIDTGLATERLAAIMREFVERRFDVSATRLTTAELLAACEAAEWPAERLAPLRDSLERCDRAKFAGDPPDAAGLQALIGSARAWVAAARPDPARSLDSPT
jgi:hypothetical protein